MSAVLNQPTLAAGAVHELPKSAGVWTVAWRRLKNDRVGMVSLVIVLLFLLMILLSAVGLVASNWQREAGVPYAPPTFTGQQPDPLYMPSGAVQGSLADISAVDPLAPKYAEWAERASKFQAQTVERANSLPLGGDRLGRDVLTKAIKGSEVSIFVGLAAALMATFTGTLLGAFAGYFGGRIGDFLEWVYNVKTSIPYILLVFALAALIKNSPLLRDVGGVWTTIIILSIVGWTGIYRLVRAEYIKHSNRDYVRAAQAIGVSHSARMFVHILPNISHVVLVQLSLLVVAFIKTEVILSFLGLGVPVDMVSWGTMLSESQTELVLGKWWQLAAATVFMALFVTAFSLFTDALRDALDPKLR
jgi:peptide/nickel transport system permease protein